MDRDSKLALALLALAIPLGIVGDLLLRAEPWGVNALVAAVAFATGVQLLVRRLDLPLGGVAAWVTATIPPLAAILAWRDTGPLMALVVLAVLVSLAFAGFIAHGRLRAGAGPGSFVADGFAMVLHGLFGPFRLMGRMRGAMVVWAPWNTRAGAITRGALLAIPPLLVFGALFVAADAAFAHLLSELVHVHLEEFASHLLLAGFFAWLAAGWLFWVVIDEGAGLRPGPAPALRVGALELRVALALIIALFAAFVAVQFTYLFGGESLVRATTGLTYAEYARSGFFQLVVVAVLVLPMLLVALWLVRDEPLPGRRVVRFMAAALVVLVFIIIASAFQRMRLYQAAYGLTQLRFLTTAFILWLALLFVLFAATVLRGSPRGFAPGAVVSALLAVVLLAIVNPDARIVAANVARARAGAEFDASYLRELGADAVPGVLDALPSLPEPARCGAVRWAVRRWGSAAVAARPGDWRSWNLSRARARQLVREREQGWQGMVCPDSVVKAPGHG